MNAPTITPTAASTRYVDRDTLFEVERFLTVSYTHLTLPTNREV